MFALLMSSLQCPTPRGNFKMGDEAHSGSEFEKA